MKIINILHFSFIIALSLIFSHCKKVEIPNVDYDSLPVISNLVISHELISIGYFQDTVEFYIKNKGATAFSWEVNFDKDFISFSQDTGYLEPFDSVFVKIFLDRSTVEIGWNGSQHTIKNSSGFQKSLSIEAFHHVEEKWLIEHPITDAEFDKNNNVIVAISKADEVLMILDPETLESTIVPMNKIPNCVSVSSDGKFAVVGHSGAVSYVNLETGVVDKIYTVFGKANDIVFADNGWVYAFPDKENFGWERIQCLHLATGSTNSHVGDHIHPRTKAKLHPSGKYIYGADNGVSPTNFEKYDITGGTAQYMYDSPYHSEYNFNGDIWISEDGERLYAPSRNIFRATENNDDITFLKEISGAFGQKMVWFVDSEIAQKIYTIFQTTEIGFPFRHPERFVRKYNAHHDYRGKINMPDFLVPDGNGSGAFFPGNPRFCFFNNQGTKLYVLATAEVRDAYTDHWAVINYEVD